MIKESSPKERLKDKLKGKTKWIILNMLGIRKGHQGADFPILDVGKCTGKMRTIGTGQLFSRTLTVGYYQNGVKLAFSDG